VVTFKDGGIELSELSGNEMHFCHHPQSDSSSMQPNSLAYRILKLTPAIGAPVAWLADFFKRVQPDRQHLAVIHEVPIIRKDRQVISGCHGAYQKICRGSLNSLRSTAIVKRSCFFVIISRGLKIAKSSQMFSNSLEL
jgi:hypothetical protein